MSRGSAEAEIKNLSSLSGLSRVVLSGACSVRLATLFLSASECKRLLKKKKKKKKRPIFKRAIS